MAGEPEREREREREREDMLADSSVEGPSRISLELLTLCRRLLLLSERE